MEATERAYEERRLERVMQEVRHQIAKNQESVESHQKEVLENRKWMAENLTSVDEADTAELGTSLQTLAGQERMYRLRLRSMNKLERVAHSPYFGRIDFTEQGYTDLEKIYLGIASLIDEETGDPLIYDWRAPISSMFYDYELGHASFRAPGGQIEGEVSLKRQFKISDGVLEFMFDSSQYIGDDYLKELIGKSTDDKMKSIVTSIQREQNQVIRNDEHRLLVVQGAAGSGKTSIALQRLAYLLYKYRERILPDEMLILSPNKIFSDYISNVLPELGEQNVQQTTFQEHVESRLSRYQVDNLYSQMEELLSTRGSQDQQIRDLGVQWKGSFDFLELVVAYTRHLDEQGLPFPDLVFKGKTQITGAAIAEQFHKTYRRMEFHERLRDLKKWLRNTISALPVIDTETELLMEREKKESLEYQGTDAEIEVLRGRVIKEMLGSFAEYHKMVNFYRLYMRLLRDKKLIKQIGFDPARLPAEYDSIRKWTLEHLRERQVPFEDAAALLYLKNFVEGMREKYDVKILVVDEGQDYTPMQYAVLKQLYPRSRVTVLGDLNQSIHPSQLQETLTVDTLSRLFKTDEATYIRLEKSYRSTLQIAHFAQGFLLKKPDVELLSRSGELPKVIQVTNAESLPRLVTQDIEALKQEGFRSIAVLCKTAAESRRVFKQLRALQGDATNDPYHLVSKEDREYTSGVVVVPTYLAKGLEFDAVLLYDVSSDTYSGDRERRLLYTSCTRAMHHLHLYYKGTLSPLVTEIDHELYRTESR